METVEQRIGALRRLAEQQTNAELHRMVQVFIEKSALWDSAPTTLLWTWDSMGVPKGGSKSGAWSCPAMYRLVQSPPGRVEMSCIRGHEHPACHTDWTVTPDRRSITVTHYNTHPDPAANWNKFIDEQLTFVFEKVPKDVFVFS